MAFAKQRSGSYASAACIRGDNMAERISEGHLNFRVLRFYHGTCIIKFLEKSGLDNNNEPDGIAFIQGFLKINIRLGSLMTILSSLGV